MSRTEPTIAGRVSELLKPRFYGPGVNKVRMLQTHTSWVFLTGRHAYKVKKPVNFGFLDYTTLSARRFFCHEEFRLNQQLSPDIYLEVTTVGERGGRLVLGRGRTVDYALKMCELPQSSIMTERLLRGEVNHEHISEIARAIAAFHDHAERGPEVSRYGSSEIVRLNWDENFAQTLEFRGRTVTYPGFDEIRQDVGRFIHEKRHLFRHRREAGHVRKCHGDLHSKNVFVGDKVHIFDCIEFNPRFSCSDVASEIAFMVMDLDFFGRHDLACHFVERYLVHTRDYGLLRLLDFYSCYRAYVRGKVTSFNLNDAGISARDKARARETARRYFQLSLGYARRLFRPNALVVMVGLPGTGKSYLARRLAARIGAFHLLSDSIRKQLVGVPVGSKQIEGTDRGIYKPSISRRTYQELMKRTRLLLNAGQTVIADATFLRDDSRQEAADIARQAGVPVLFVHSDCPESTVAGRMRRRAHEYSLSDADLSVYRRMKQRFVPPRTGRNLLRIDTRQPVGRSLDKIERALLRL